MGEAVTGSAERAIAHIRRGVETGRADEFRAALKIIAELRRDAELSPEERERQRFRALANRVVSDLGPAADAYSRHLSKQRRTP